MTRPIAPLVSPVCRAALLLAIALAPSLARAQPATSPYEQLVALLAHHPRTGAPVDSIAELLPLLPDELRANFTLVHTSRSPHRRDVDPLHPRVVLFTRDARLLVAFDGKRDAFERDVLEVIHFRDRERAFALSRFVLPAAARRDPMLAERARTNGALDPPACRRCHGDDPRPINDSYFLWPGFYGSVQDRFLPDGDELRSYRTFLAGERQAPGGVYRELLWSTTTDVPPYFLDPSLVESDRIDIAPNTRLGMALTELNRRRIARRIEASPRWPALRDKLLAGLLGCAPLPISDGDRARIETALAVEDRAKLDRQGVSAGIAERATLSMAERTSVDNLAEIDFVARVLDVSRADWSMALEPDSLALYDGILSGEATDGADFYFKEDLLLELLRGLAAVDAAVKPYFAVQPFYRDQPFGARLDLSRARGACSLLARRARLVPWPATTTSPPSVARRAAGNLTRTP